MKRTGNKDLCQGCQDMARQFISVALSLILL